MLPFTKIVSAIALCILFGCNHTGVQQQITPFADRPHETYLIQSDLVNITGNVWLFERTGKPVIYGGPVGLIYEGEPFHVISVVGTGIELKTTSDVMKSNPKEINDLIEAAKGYCASQHFVEMQSGVSVHTDGDRLYLVGVCAPPEMI